MRQATKIISVLFILSLIAALLCSCVSGRDLRRKRRAIRKIERAREISPESFYSDTVYIHDTITTTGYKHDTVNTVIYHDSVIVIDNQKVTLKYFYDTLTREIYHEVDCKGEKIITTNRIIREKYKPFSWYEKIQLRALSPAILASLIAILVLLLVKRRS